MSSSDSLMHLPTEIQIQIMCNVPDIHSFQSLVLACRHFYGIYRENQLDILTGLVRQILHVRINMAVEAETCAAAQDIDFEACHDKHNALVDFINTYRTKRAEQLGSDQSFQSTEKIVYPVPNLKHTEIESTTRKVERRLLRLWPPRNPDLLLRITKRHMMLEKCVHRFSQKALATSKPETDFNQKLHLRSVPFSRVEMQRLYRAFYRFEMYHLLMDKRSDRQIVDHCPTIWLSCFPSHEIEEIGVVYQWLCEEWLGFAKNTKDPKLNPLARQSYWTEEWSISWSIVTRGLQFFLTATGRPEYLYLPATQDMCYSPEPEQYIGSVLSYPRSIRDLFFLKSADDGLPDDGAELSFDGDHPDCPNAAWLWSNYSRMTSHFFHSQDADLRRIGYVMWDAERLSSWALYDKPRCFSRPRSAMRER